MTAFDTGPDERPPLLVIDDHELVGRTIAIALRARGHDAHYCAVQNREQILASAAGLPPGIVLLDLELGTDAAGRPVRSVDLIGDLTADGWRVLIVTGLTDQARLAAAIAAGALGIARKVGALDGFYNMIDDVAAGRLITPAERRAWAHEHRRHKAAEHRLTMLTIREREILDDLAAGMRAVAIAAAAGVSVATVRTHIRAVLRKLGVGSQLEAVALLRAHRGLSSP